MIFRFASALATSARLYCTVNAGQWQSNALPGRTGWPRQTSGEASRLHVATEPFMSAPDDAQPNTPWLDLVAGDGLQVLTGVSFWPWSSDTRSTVAQLRLLDAQGSLDDAALGDMRDVPVRVRSVVQGSPLDSAVPVGRWVLDRIDIEDDGRKTAVLRDPHDDLDEPLHRAVFLSATVDESQAWSPQPVVIGTVRSAPMVSLNSDGTVQLVADAPLASAGLVRDRGAPIDIGAGAELVAGGQQLAFVSPPVGPVLADVSTEPSMAPASLERALGEVFRRIGKTAWASTDAAAIDQATGYAGVGYYAGEASTPRAALDALLKSYAAAWWQDADGILRITRLEDPDAAGMLAFDLDWRELDSDLGIEPDLAPGLSRRMSYQPNAQPLAAGDMITDLVQLPQSVRHQLSGDYRGVVYGGGRLASRYARAESAAPLASRFDRREDAQTEINRVIALYSVPRNFYTGRLRGRPDLNIRPGQIGRITYHRYGLEAGRNVLVASVLSNPVTGDHTLRFWGA